MNLVKFYLFVLAQLLIFEISASASFEAKIIPENFSQKMPESIGTPTLYLNGDFPEKIYPIKRSDVLSSSIEKPIKEARLEFGTQHHRIAYCKDERNAASNKGPVTISVTYEDDKFSCNLRSE